MDRFLERARAAPSSELDDAAEVGKGGGMFQLGIFVQEYLGDAAASVQLRQ